MADANTPVTLLNTLDRPALVAAAVRASVEAGNGLHGRAYICDVAQRVGVTRADLMSNLETFLGDFMLLRGDIRSTAANANKLRHSRSQHYGEDVYFIDVRS